MDEFKMKNQLTPYPTERMVMFDQYEAGYSAGYSAGHDKGYLIGREQGVNVGKRDILDRIAKLMDEYPNMVDFAYEVTHMMYEEKEKQDAKMRDYINSTV
jgi:flagellar biosynthesis/type III secretory pathway protein FliH